MGVGTPDPKVAGLKRRDLGSATRGGLSKDTEGDDGLATGVRDTDFVVPD